MGHDSLVDPARRLPDLRLAPASGGEPRPLRPGGRRAPVLVMVHPPGCADCDAYVRALEAERESITEWDGYPLVIEPGAAGAAAGSGVFPALADPEGRLGAALGLTPPAVVIADQWGEIHERAEAGEEHRFPKPAEVVSWLSYLAVQCPECQGEAY